MKKETEWTPLGLVLLAISRPFVWFGRWFSKGALVSKICVVLAIVSFWGLSRLKIEPVRLSMPTFNPMWLIVPVVIVVLVFWLRSRKVQPSPSQAEPEKPQALSTETPPVKKSGTWKVLLLIVVFTLFCAWILRLIFWDQITQEIRPHFYNFTQRHGLAPFGDGVIGDGGAEGTREARVEKIGSGLYRVFMPADAGWDPTHAFWPDDKLVLTVEQRFFKRLYSHDARNWVDGIPYHGRLKTPLDLPRRSQAKFYMDQTLPLCGLLLKAGEGGIPQFCGQGGEYTVPGGLCLPFTDCRQMLFFGLNIGQKPSQRDLLDGTIVFTIRVVHSNHPII